MAGVSVNISLKGVGEVRKLLNRYAQAVGGGSAGGGNRAELHQRYGIQALNWINRNFQTQGGLLSAGPWAKLSPNTIAGRRKGSSQILQDTGAAGLKGSFTMQFSDQQVAIGSSKKIALYHEKGTGLYGPRRASYPIYPKRAKALAFKVAGPAFNKLKTVTAGGTTFKVGVATPIAASFSSLATRKTFAQGENYLLRAKVIHPGVQIRHMLPTQVELMPQLLKTTTNFLNELKRKGEQL